MRSLLAVAIVCLVSGLFLVQPALADLLVLKNGVKHSGTLSNRAYVRSHYANASVVSILLEDGVTLERFSAFQIDYIVLEDPAGNTVLDLAAVSTDVKKRVKRRQDSASGGVFLILLGAASTTFGVAHKFGDEKATITNSSLDYSESSYNGTNYALMIGGVAALVAGALMVAKYKKPKGEATGFELPPEYPMGIQYTYCF